ncbi:hypothetical protein AY555_07600 [Haematospirillum jordaniae]|uniref:Secreted protein n=1 Tax=Haematospirillum jordaniae TaxID=1549855 RepID=A0A143DE82_9PROT|nr:hypothetical protein AY555_07600 [Haematospirillum jordaniae]
MLLCRFCLAQICSAVWAYVCVHSFSCFNHGIHSYMLAASCGSAPAFPACVLTSQGFLFRGIVIALRCAVAGLFLM